MLKKIFIFGINKMKNVYNVKLKNIKFTEKCRDRLTTLTKRTKIQHKNVLCRWALCKSLEMESSPTQMELNFDSPFEISWPVFAGEYQDILKVLVVERAIKDGLEVNSESINLQLKLHINRGIGQLVGPNGIKNIQDLFKN